MLESGIVKLVRDTLKITRGDVSLAIDALSDKQYYDGEDDTAMFIISNRPVLLDFLAEYGELVAKENGLIVYNLDGFNYKFAV